MSKPASSPEQLKAKESAKKEQASAMSAAALMNIPKDKDVRQKDWQDLEQLQHAAKSAGQDVAKQSKKLIEVRGYTKIIVALRKMLKNASEGEFQATMRQMPLVCEDLGRPIQMDMFSGQPGGGEPVEADKPLFDTSKSGSAIGGERGDDPGRARRPGGPPPAPKIETPNVGVEGLAAGIKQKPQDDDAADEQAAKAERQRAEIDAQKKLDAGAFDSKPKDEPEVAAAKSKGKVGKADLKVVPKAVVDEDFDKMTPAQKRAATKDIADGIKRQPSKAGMGPGGIH